MSFTLLSHLGFIGGPNGGTSSGIDTTGASVLIWHVSGYNQLPSTLSDSYNNDWVQVETVLSTYSGGGYRVTYIAFPAPSQIGTGHTFTALGSSQFISFCVAAFGGTCGFAGFTHANSGFVTSMQAGSTTPPMNGCLLIAGLSMTNGISGAVGIDSSFSIIDQVAYSYGTYFGSALAYYVQPTAAAVNPTWSWTGSAGVAADLLVIIPTTSGGGGSGSGSAFCFAS